MGKNYVTTYLVLCNNIFVSSEMRIKYSCSTERVWLEFVCFVYSNSVHSNIIQDIELWIIICKIVYNVDHCILYTNNASKNTNIKTCEVELVTHRTSTIKIVYKITFPGTVGTLG